MPGDYNEKGYTGLLMDLRRSMIEVHEAAGQWVTAFDAGDEEALTHLSTIFIDVLGDVTEINEALRKMIDDARSRIH